VAIWSPIYGKNLIESEKPYVATLRDEVWREMKYGRWSEHFTVRRLATA
jgi:hypothetical protein